MDFQDDPERMTPEERLREVAAILAVGYLRLRNRNPELAQVSPEPADKPLDCSAEPSRSLAERLTGGDAGQTEAGK